ncbi:MAG: hypothetical protein CML57_11065 [Rhodobacteraceae bacterium]|nr:hypothetical protein [Paracoccaceae bacterium]
MVIKPTPRKAAHRKRSQNLFGKFTKKVNTKRTRTFRDGRSKKRYKFTNPNLLVQPPTGLAYGMQPPQNLFVGSAQFPIVL